MRKQNTSFITVFDKKISHFDQAAMHKNHGFVFG